jgi:CheY-like chemotaxis protein
MRKGQAPNTDGCRSATVLLVDDDPDCRHLFRDALGVGNIACALHEVASGPEALDFLRRQGTHADAPRPDLIYLDIEMPGASGYEVLGALKEDPRLRDIPVVMLTGLNSQADMNLAATRGADDFIVKPLDPAAFVDSVAKATSYWLAKSAPGPWGVRAWVGSDARKEQ